MLISKSCPSDFFIIAGLALEKYLKAYIISKDDEIKELSEELYIKENALDKVIKYFERRFKTHDLGRLLDSALGFDSSFESIKKRMMNFKNFFVGLRYPYSDKFPIGGVTSSEKLYLLDELVAFIRSKIDLPSEIRQKLWLSDNSDPKIREILTKDNKFISKLETNIEMFQ